MSDVPLSTITTAAPAGYTKTYRKCGKANCATCSQGRGHGPYWYRTWREGDKVRSRYVGRELPVQREPQAFSVKTLGRLLVLKEDGSALIPVGKQRELFTLLLSSPYGSVGREELAESVWPDQDPVSGERNLKAAISSLRRRLGNTGFVQRNGPSVMLRLPMGCRDDQIFEALARRALAEQDVSSMRSALDHWSGQFLPDDVYSDWTIYRRQILNDLHRRLVIDLAAGEESSSAETIEHLRQLLLRDGADEDASSALIHAFHRAGRRSEAIRVFNAVTQSLRDELGVDPSPNFVETNRQLLSLR